VIAAMLSYRFLEHPFLRLKERFARVLSRPERQRASIFGRTRTRAER
jgi:peptidoglycan/LPS O-acetylase OafA/YrhL